MPRDNINIQIKATGAPEFKKFCLTFVNDLRKAFGISWVRWQWWKVKLFVQRGFVRSSTYWRRKK